MRSAWRRITAVLAAVINWRFFKPLVFVACAAKLAWLAWAFHLAWTGKDPSALGVNPKSELLHQTGLTALTLLLITLSITPFRRIFGINGIQRVRRMVGVWTFVYALAHLTIYLTLDQLCYSVETCQWRAIWQDVLQRPFIFMGQLAFVCLLLLAITSTAGWVRRLKKNWVRLHRLVYVAGGAAVIHFIWIQKSDISEPLRWAAWLAGLLLFRVGWALVKRRKAVQRPVTA